MAKKKVILPTKMSALIKLALKDIRKMEKTAGVVVDMSTFFAPKSEIVCATHSGAIVEKRTACVLCAAGAVMAGTLGANIRGQSKAPQDFKGNENQLNAIDCLREGSVGDAASNLGLFTDDYGPKYAKYSAFNETIPEYEPMNPKPFHKAMEKLQVKLEKAGL